MNSPKFIGRPRSVRRQLLSLAVAAFVIAQSFLPLQAVSAATLAAEKGQRVTPSFANPNSTVFINELHYDDSTAAGDTNEFVEIAAPAGTNLANYSIVLYNGNGGAAYDTTALSGIVADQQGGYGTAAITYATNGVQNGSPDGIALINTSNNTLVQFLCYEGTFAATGTGPASGVTCTDIGVSETNSTAPGSSLHLTGTGSKYGDFTWSATTTNTKGAVNTGQTFNAAPPVDVPPTVQSTTPADNATGVAVNANISVTFSEPVTATASSFTISCSQSGAHAFTLSGGPTTYTLDPTVDFTQGEVCTVTVVAAQVTDQDGTPNNMAQDYVFDFTIINTAPVKINQIQGSGATSPLAGQTVMTSGIVTLLKTGTNNGGAASSFFLQEPTASNDADPNTSEGILVFTSSVPTVGVGDNVTVTGTVVEFNGMTEISPVSSVSVNSTGNSLPDAVVLTTTILDPTAPPTQPQLEKYEGMRMSAASLKTVAPNDNFYDVDTVLGSVPRPMREPGIGISETVPPDPTTGTPDCCIPRWDENPERLPVDTNGRAGAPLNPYTSNVTFTNVAGPLDFAFSRYRLIPETNLTASPNMSAVPVPTPTSNEFTVGHFNVENFNNNATQRQKAALAVRDVMKLPDIIGVIEIFELTGLQALATEINTISPGVNYQPYLVEADSTTGDADQDVGYLVNANRVAVDSVTQIELAGCMGNAATCNTYTDPNTGQPAYLNDRPPLVLRARVQPAGANLPVITVVNHLRSFIDIELVTGEGPRVRAKRKAQAEFLADLLQDLQTDNPTTSVISVGDYNAFQFNDGYTDPLSVIKGNPTPDEQMVVDQSPDLVNPNYVNLIDKLPTDQQYSFIFENTAQALDHILVNTVANSRNTRIAFARNNADFPETPAAAFASNATRPERNSDHDMPVGYFSLVGAVAQPGTVLISEFRFNGPNGTADEFIELYNNSDSQVNLAGWSIAAPAGTGGGGVTGLTGTMLPRGHYLVALDSYSVSGYPSLDNEVFTAVPDRNYLAASFLDDGGAQLRDANGIVIDSVGFSSANGTGFREGAGLTPASGVVPGASDQYSFVRKMTTGFPQDTNDNAADFVLVSTTGAVGATIATLGAPGPENTDSPIQRNAVIKASLIDNCNGIGTPTAGCQNRVRNGAATNPTNAATGTLSFRRRFTNTTVNEAVYRLRFRIVDITTLNSPGYAPNNGQADLRVLSSTSETVSPSNPFVPGNVIVQGTTLEQPPTQALGGGLNSSLTVDVDLSADPLEPGENISVQFLVGVQQNGFFRFFVNVEAITADPPSPPPAFKAPQGKNGVRRQ